MDLKKQIQREIKFRGLRTDGSAWVYGDLCSNIYFKNETKTKCFYILQMPEGGDCDEDIQFIEVIPESVGQHTGLKDKNGVDIYEGDILASHRHYFYSPGVVVFEDRGWKIEFGGESHFCVDSVWESVEVVGNIHDNPEMINIAVSE